MISTINFLFYLLLIRSMGRFFPENNPNDFTKQRKKENRVSKAMMNWNPREISHFSCDRQGSHMNN